MYEVSIQHPKQGTIRKHYKTQRNAWARYKTLRTEVIKQRITEAKVQYVLMNEDKDVTNALVFYNGSETEWHTDPDTKQLVVKK